MSLILLTNDDGVQSPGLLALKQALGPVAEVTVLAPDHNWSAGGHAKTMHKPLRVQEVRLADGSTALTSNGGPSDCVALAVLGVLPRLPDLVISGINPGSNVAQDMTYSGTVAAALEGWISGISSMALSVAVEEGTPPEFGSAARVGALIVRHLLESGQSQVLLNVNVPSLPFERLKGVEITRLGRRIYRDRLVERRDPRGRKYYWIGGEPPTGVPDEGTDVGTLSVGKVSVTPLQLDLTSYPMMDELRGWNLSIGG